jgi:hypothetical protein
MDNVSTKPENNNEQHKCSKHQIGNNKGRLLNFSPQSIICKHTQSNH